MEYGGGKAQEFGRHLWEDLRRDSEGAHGGWMDGKKGCTGIAATLMTDDVGEVQTWEEKQIVGRGGVHMYSRGWRWM